MPQTRVNAEATKLNPSAVLNLFELRHSTLEPLYFYAGISQNLNSLIFDNVTYVPVPIELSEFEIDGRGRLPRPKITISNVKGLISTYLLQIGDISGASIRRKRVFYKYIDDINFDGGANPWGLADPTAIFSDELFYINRKLLENKEVVEFELATPWEIDNEKLPKRTIYALICGFQYREVTL